MIRTRVTVQGVVQGVGFRPFTWRRATRLALAGSVANETGGVAIEVEGPRAAVAAFLETLVAEAPPLARVERVEVREVAATGGAGFAILPGGETAAPATAVPPDVATCAACLADVSDPANRRHGHPFAACTDCGPRLTIIERLPYDRAATTMRDFGMCADCAREYADPADRRFHAEAIACPRCGPGLWFTRPGPDAARDRGAAAFQGTAALDAARHLLRTGGILALKGIGGFHLACDATDEAAVARLRARKGRVGKPLAVMVADTAAARRVAIVDEQERSLLEGPARPIVLLRKRPEGETPTALAAGVAPGVGVVGVVLPYSPLHHLLVAGLPPLVMTSGNLADEPIACDAAEALDRLGGVADAFLLHDRRIQSACDDSVVRCAAGAAVPIRRSRGHAPLPVRLAASGPPVLAVGGELKAALCVAQGDRAVMSPHVGDMGNVETLAALGRAAEHLLRLCGVEPVAVVADLHPGYLSTGWARSWAAARGLPFVQVQHHEAHAAALLAEHGLDAAAGPFCIACCDGTGYGRDGTIQGGEFFRVEAGAIRHVARLAPFPLPGGDAAIRHPWRVALALLHAAGLPWDERLPAVRLADAAQRRVLGRQLDRGVACVATTSMGRLFDAVAARAGVTQSITYEAEAALALETLAAAAGPVGEGYAFTIDAVGAAAPLRIGWRDLLAAVAADAVTGVEPAVIAARFHEAVARMIVAVADRLGGAGPVGLTGGVFQNALVVERTVALLRDAGREALLHHRVPPNDGGLALGQAVLARRHLIPAPRDPRGP
ncbi:MAG: carbamoyltransferase HypF [Planctomycetaceae bacterium]